MGHLNDFLTHVAESFTNLFNLEADPSLSERENVERVIEQSATVACICSIILPIPAADFVVLTPIQAKMTVHVGRLKGYELEHERAKEIVQEILGVLGMTLTAHLVIVSVSKFVPLGGVLTVPLIYAATWAIGNVVDYYFDCLTSGQTPSQQTMKNLFSEQFRVGKRKGQELDRDELQRKAEEVRRKVAERDAELATQTRLHPGGGEAGRGDRGAPSGPAPGAAKAGPGSEPTRPAGSTGGGRPKIKITLPEKGDSSEEPGPAAPPVRKTIGPEPAPAPEPKPEPPSISVTPKSKGGGAPPSGGRAQASAADGEAAAAGDAPPTGGEADRGASETARPADTDVPAAPSEEAAAAAPEAAAAAGRLVAQLERLARLREAGVLDDEEFEQAKRKLLHG